MSSLFFQMGRLTTLDSLVGSSLEALLQPRVKDDDDDDNESVTGGDAEKDATTASRKRGRSKRKPPVSGDDGGDDDGIKKDAPSQTSSETYENLKVKASDPRWVKRFLTLINIRTELLIEKGEFSKAIDQVYMAAKALDVTLEFLPPDILVRLGVAHAYLGQADVTDRIFQQLLDSCDPSDFGDALYDGAVSLIKVGKISVSRRILLFLQRSEEFSTIAAVHFQLGICAKREGKFKEARRYFQRVLELEPLHLESRLAMGSMYYDEGNVAKAIETLAPKIATDTTVKDPSFRFDPNSRSTGDEEVKEDPFDRVLLDCQLATLYEQEGNYINAVTTALPLFEKIMVADDPTESIATGGSKRRRQRNAMPIALAATSAIVPTAATSGSGAISILPASLSVASSFRSSGSAASVRLQQRGAALSSTATSRGALTEGGRDNQGLTDPSAIFRFKRSRRKESAAKQEKKKNDSSVDQRAEIGNEEGGRYQEKQRREELIHSMKQQQQGGSGGGVDDDGRGSVGNLDDLEQMEQLQALEAMEAEQQRKKQAAEDAEDARPTKRVRFEEPTTKVEQWKSSPVEEDGVGGGAAMALGGTLGSGGEDGAIPSLEDIARSFADPQLAALFLQANSNLGVGDDANPAVEGDDTPKEIDPLAGGRTLDIEVAGGGDTRDSDPKDYVHELSQAQLSVDAQRKPGAEDLLQLLTVDGVVELALRIMRCYRRLGQLLDAKIFGTSVIRALSVSTRKKQDKLLRLRMEVLTLSVELGEGHNVVRTAVHLIENAPPATVGPSGSLPQSSDANSFRGGGGGDARSSTFSTSATSVSREEMVHQVFTAINRLVVSEVSISLNPRAKKRQRTHAGGSSTAELATQRSLGIIRRGNIRDTPALMVLGNRFFHHGTYAGALRCYLLALANSRQKKKPSATAESSRQQTEGGDAAAFGVGTSSGSSAPTTIFGVNIADIQQRLDESQGDDDAFAFEDDLSDLPTVDAVFPSSSATELAGSSSGVMQEGVSSSFTSSSGIVGGGGGSSTTTATTTFQGGGQRGVVGDDDPLLHFLIGLCYLFLVGRRTCKTSKHVLVLHGMAYLQQYLHASRGQCTTVVLKHQQAAVKTEDSHSQDIKVVQMTTSDTVLAATPPSSTTTTTTTGFCSYPLSFEVEAVYNMGRAYQYLELSYLAIPWYEQVLDIDVSAICEEEKVGELNDASSPPVLNYSAAAEGERIMAFQRAAAVNLSLIYRHSGNNELAASVLYTQCPPL